jgi:hypothetical protein
MSAHHAEAVEYVFDDEDGYLVMFDRGEFGGGVEWYERTAALPDRSQSARRSDRSDPVLTAG